MRSQTPNSPESKVSEADVTPPTPLLLSKQEVELLKSNWSNCLPVELGNLFAYQSPNGIARYDTYNLSSENIDFLINKLNQSNSPSVNNILTISFEMGKGKLEGDSLGSSTGPTDDIFLPLLKVVLKNAFNDEKVYHFPLNPETKCYSFKSRKAFVRSMSDTGQQISPKVAELFILKWQSLLDVEVVNAFEGLTADSVSITELGEERGEVLFSSQKLRRVRGYNFDVEESNAIVAKMKGGLERGMDVKFFVNLGAGLTVADFHPFSFRPIIKIELRKNENSGFVKLGETVVKDEDKDENDYYDTSRPCPPFCDSE